MRNRQWLAKLASTHGCLLQIREEGISIIVKSLHIRAGQNQNGVRRTSVIELRSTAVIRTMKIARRYCRLRAFPVIKHELCAHENIRHAVRGHTALGVSKNTVSLLLSARNPLDTQRRS